MAKAAVASTNGHVNRIAAIDNPSYGAAVEATITAPNFKVVEVNIRGTAPYVQLAFGEKARNMMREKQAAGSTSAKGKKRVAKDFDGAFEEALHRSQDGWCGIPAGALRKALVAACSVVGFHMTKAKKGIFIDADGFDGVEGTPLIKINGKPRHVEHSVRNATGVADIRVRALYDVGWTATLRIRFDADMFTVSDIGNLMMRAGLQIGVGEGRPDSKNSCGMGWGTFEVVSK